MVLPQVPGEIVPPIMGLAFENFDAGKKIFRGWHKRLAQKIVTDGWV